MKKYSIPEMNVSLFERENVVTESGAVTSAFDEAKEAAQNVSDSKHRFTVTF